MVKPWDTATIGDFLDFKNGLNKSKEFFGHGTPIVNYTDVYKKRGLKKNDVCGKVSLTRDEIHRFDARKNDVFFTRTSETPEEVGMSSVLLEDIDDCVFSGFVLRGRPKNDMFVPEYCKYCFTTEAVRSAIIMGCTYTTRALTNGKQLSTIEIVVPPKPEQEAIAKTLAEIDELISSLEKLITKEKAIKQGAMQELLTGKRRLPGFTREWQHFIFGELFDFIPNNAFTRAQMSESGKVKNIHYGDILTKYGAYVNGSSDLIPYISKKVDLARFADRCYLQSADIIMADTAEDETVGKVLEVVSVDCPILAGQHTLLCRPKVKFAPKFLGYYLNAACYHDQLIPYIVGTKVSSVSKASVAQTELVVPDYEEQQAVAEILSNMDSEIEALEQKLAKYRQVKQGMMQQLLTGKLGWCKGGNDLWLKAR